MAEQITLFGKGGVGKTTLAANLSAALAEAGQKVVLIGCDMKIDTGILVHGQAEIPTLLDYVRVGTPPKISDIAIPGYRGIVCFEVGDSLVDDECATRNIGRALGVLRDLNLIGNLKPDYVVYDTPGEIAQPTVCDWKLGECEPVPGKTMPELAIVERDYPGIYRRFLSLGSASTRSSVG